MSTAHWRWAPAVTAAHPITVRHPAFDLSGLPPDWVGGSALATCFGDAGHVFIPLGEDFFIDTVRSFRERVEDAGLRRQVNAFIGQETMHRRVHAGVWEALRERGVPVDAYARLIERLRSVERVVPPTLRLSVTAALEHWTAAFGCSFLTEDLRTAVPDEMAALLAWHGLEELEHRAVAFDVLELVDDRYLTRLAGFVVASGLILVVPAVGTAMFAAARRRDRRTGGRSPTGDDRAGASGPSGLAGMTARFAWSMGGHLAAYLRPGFHPSRTGVPPEAALVIADLERRTTG